jgi:uncharacterized protein
MEDLKMETIKPFIHMLRSPFGFYFFDVNRNEIVSTTEEVYKSLCQILDADESEAKELLRSMQLYCIPDVKRYVRLLMTEHMVERE